MALSRLMKIDLRKAWPHEALDYTNWLSEPENLELLSEEVGIDITGVQTEAPVGRFSVDILAEEENTGRKIVIENQLETTDHDHLGKIITYASGYDAEIIIWIVKDVRDEHKQAIDWLNEHTDEKINFFAIKMELWQIDGSAFAPKFQIISKPNDWAKAIKQSNARGELSEHRLMQLEFWNKFKEFAVNKKTSLKLRKASPKHWLDISIGSSKTHLALTIDAGREEVRCELYIPNSNDLYEALLARKKKITEQLDHDLEWMSLDGKKACRIRVIKSVDVGNSDNWDECFDWLLRAAQDFLTVFSKQVKTINIK